MGFVENTDRDLTPEQRAKLYPRVTSFRFRRGALTPAQQRNYDNLWPTLGMEVGEERLDTASWFGRSHPTVLEIGCGTGTSTAAMAAEEPHIDVLACEVYLSGIGQLLGLVERNGLDNVRIVRGDAVAVLTDMIAPQSLTGIRVFFPDPWPKARHHKRRLLQGGTFALFAEALADDGVLHIATDHADYAEAIAEELDAQQWFIPVPAAEQAALPISLNRPVTKFEGRAHREGRSITEFVYRRLHRSQTQKGEPDGR